MKQCSKCKQEKEESNFYNSSYTKDRLAFWCKDCCKQYRINNSVALLEKKKQYWLDNRDTLRLKNKKKYEANKDTYVAQQREYYAKPENRAKKILWKTHERAKKFGIDFNLDIDDIVLNEYCPYLGLKLTHDLGRGQLETNSSIDRIDPTKGYIKNNVEIISRKANTMKNNASIDELITFSINVLKRLKPEVLK